MSQKGDQAHKWAHEIYSLSTKCLMAHSIRAVEQYIEDHLGHLPHRIKVIESKPMTYLGKRAIAYIHIGRTEIKVDSGIGFEEQRKAIAHELGHVLFAKSKGGMNRIVSRDNDTESACYIFEKDLCALHSKFYSDETNIKKLRFPSLDPHP